MIIKSREILTVGEIRRPHPDFVFWDREGNMHTEVTFQVLREVDIKEYIESKEGVGIEWSKADKLDFEDPNIKYYEISMD